MKRLPSVSTPFVRPLNLSVSLGLNRTMKSAALVAVPPAVVTVIRPVVAPGGTRAVSRPAPSHANAAVTPLKATALAPSL